MKIVASILTLICSVTMLSAESYAASKKVTRSSKPPGSLVSDPALLFDVTDSAGKTVKCLLSNPPAAGTLKVYKKKNYFLKEATKVASKIKSAKKATAKKLKAAKTKKAKTKLKAKLAAQIAALNSALDTRNGLCSQVAEQPGNGGSPLPVACVDLTPYDGPWTEDVVGALYDKVAWGATLAEKAEGAARGRDYTVDNLLLRKNGLVATPALDQRVYDWKDGQLGNVTGANPQDPEDVDFDGIQYALVDTFRFSPNKFQTHLLHQTMQALAASYRVLNGDERHAYYEHLNKLKDFVSTGNFKRLTEEMAHDHLYAVRWLNLEASVPEDPNEDFARELIQLASRMGQFNMCDPNRGLNYNDQDIAAMAKVLAGKYRTTYDNSLQKRVLSIVPSASYNGRGGAPITIGQGTPWQTTVLNEEDVLRMIFSRMETACGIANWLIEDALGMYRDPPPVLVQRVAEMVFADGFNVYTRAVPTLMKSKAMFSSCAQKSQAKDPAEFLISFVQKTGIPVSSRNLEDGIADLGMSLGNPVSVFGWSYAATFSSRALTARDDAIVDIISNDGYQCPGPGAFIPGNQRFDRERSPDFYPACFLKNILFPKELPTESEVINHICRRILGVSLDANAEAQLVGYANFRRKTDGTLERRIWDTFEPGPIEPYNNINGQTRSIWQPKTNGFLQICAGTLDGVTK